MKKNYLKKLCFLFFFALIGLSTYAQTGSISGKVVDETNQPLPGAAVFIEGTKISTQTDANGAYRLSSINYGNVFVTVSFIGYTNLTKEVSLSTTSTSLNFKLVPSAESLSEVVVIGYGTTRKSDVTGAITTVTSKDFTKGQITSPEQLIAGKVAGVQITQGSGAPGSSSTIRIRGSASLNSTNDPLIVVDGVPLASGGISGSANALALINPNDIESFTVLKDASATAIYGNRASNGVIIITTKKGVSGKAQITFNTNYSLATVANTTDILSADQFRDLVTNATIGGTVTEALKAKMGTSSTDWQNEIYENAATTDNNLSVSGSYKDLPYRISLGYLNQNGILTTGNLERVSLSGNLSPSFLKNTLKVNLNVKSSFSKNVFADESTVIGNSSNFDPTQPIYSGNTNFGGYFEHLDAASSTGLRGLAPRNPLSYLNLKDNTSDVSRMIGNLTLDYAIPHIKGLRANANLGYDIAKGSGNIIVSPTASFEYQRFKDENGIARSGQKNFYKQQKTNFVSDAYLNYLTDLKSIKSRIDLTGGIAYQEFTTQDYYFADYSYDEVKKPNSDPNFTYDEPQNRLFSIYGRMIYTFNDKYTLTTTVRSDASSRINSNDRVGIFPSAAFAWRIAEEKFLKSSTLISDLKLRLGYGVTGQQDGIANYSYQNTYNLSSATANYQLGNTFYAMYRPDGYNPNLKWETTATSNIALDYGFLKNRIYGTLDFYYKETSDLLSTVTQAAGTNFINEFTTNVGSMTNKGVEFMINTVAIDKKDFKLNFGFNATYNKNKITKLTLNNDSSYGYQTGSISGGTGNSIQINAVGSPINTFYVYQQVYDTEGKPLDNVFVDRNGDGQVTSSDLYKYKSPNADLFLGFNSSFTYKKWNGGFTMRANLNNYVYNNVASSTGTYRNVFNPLGYLNNASTDILNSEFSGDGDKYFLSDYYIQNASFLRMDNLNFGYSFGKVLKGKANLNVSGNIQNVFVITKYDGVDPEISGGIDNSFYPRPRTFSLGLNLGF